VQALWEATQTTSTTAAENNERAFVESELQRSGFPLEIEVSSFLEERNWVVVSSPLYPDYDTQIQREIDLVALKTLGVDSQGKKLDPYQLCLTLVIQCKKSTKYHWVFYTRPRRDDKIEYEIGLAYTDFIEFARTRSLLPYVFPSLAIQHELRYGPLKAILPPTVARGLIDTHQMGIAHPKNLRCLMAHTKSVSYEEVPKREKIPEHMKIYEVATGLLKATISEALLSRRMMTLLFENVSKRQPPLGEMKWPINLFIPIVVFDGKIWKWVKKTERTDEVLLQVTLPSPNYPPPHPLVCIVGKQRLFSLVTEIEEDLLRIADLVSSNLASLNQQRAIIEESIMGPMK
jgi:hypothetical protein